jgi:hypothetical protein
VIQTFERAGPALRKSTFQFHPIRGAP